MTHFAQLISISKKWAISYRSFLIKNIAHRVSHRRKSFCPFTQKEGGGGRTPDSLPPSPSMLSFVNTQATILIAVLCLSAVAHNVTLDPHFARSPCDISPFSFFRRLAAVSNYLVPFYSCILPFPYFPRSLHLVIR